MKIYEKFKPITLILIFVLIYSCGGETNDSTTDDDAQPKERLIKDIQGSGDGGNFSSHFNYENNILSKSSVLNRGTYEVYNYNSNGRINLIRQYNDNGDVPNNSAGLDFNYANNFNDAEYLTEYVWLGTNSFTKESTQYNFNNEGLVQNVECSDSNCESVNIYYKNNQIDKVIYNEGKSFQTTYTFVFDEGINPMNTLFRKYGYVEYINLGVFDYFFDFYYINNATKIYRDGELVFTASYQYNTDNYPTEVSYVKLSNGKTGKAVFTYQ